jgi:hypothetical protein
MSIEIGNTDTLNNELSIYDKPTIKLPNSDKVIAVNPERLDYILIERLFEPKYNVFGCQVIGYIKETKQQVIVRIDQFRLLIEALLYNKKELDESQELSSLFSEDELKAMFPEITKDSQRILITFTKGHPVLIGVNYIDTKFKLIYILKELIYTLNGQESDMRSKATLQQFMMALSAGVSGQGPKNVSQSGIVY